MKMVANYGVAIVLACVAIYILFIFHKKMIDRRYGIIKDNIKSDNKIQEKEKFDHSFNIVMETGDKIEKLMYHILYELGADRVAIFEYHNGGVLKSGLSFLKISNTHEVVKSGIAPQIITLQNLPIHLFAMWNKEIMGHQEISFENINDIEYGNRGTFGLLDDQNLKSMYIIGLYDVNYEPLGFLSLDYIKSVKKFTPEEKNTLREIAAKISGLKS